MIELRTILLSACSSTGHRHAAYASLVPSSVEHAARSTSTASLRHSSGHAVRKARCARSVQPSGRSDHLLPSVPIVHDHDRCSEYEPLLFLSMRTAPYVVRDSIRLVLQANPCNLSSGEVEQLLRDGIPNVMGIHELHIWRLTPRKALATIHVVFSTADDVHKNYKAIHRIFATLHIDHVTIQPEFALVRSSSSLLLLLIL